MHWNFAYSQLNSRILPLLNSEVWIEVRNCKNQKLAFVHILQYSSHTVVENQNNNKKQV